MKTNRAVSHPALVALNGATLRIEATGNGHGETCVLLSDPNTGALVASFTFADGGRHGAEIVAHVGLRCTAREQSASYRRKGEA